MVWGLGVRIPASSLFQDEKFATFDFGVRGTPKILKICLGVPPIILKKVVVLAGAAKGFCLRREGAPALFAAQNLGGEPLRKFSILGVPLTPKSKNAIFSS